MRDKNYMLQDAKMNTSLLLQFEIFESVYFIFSNTMNKDLNRQKVVSGLKWINQERIITQPKSLLTLLCINHHTNIILDPYIILACVHIRRTINMI